MRKTVIAALLCVAFAGPASAWAQTAPSLPAARDAFVFRRPQLPSKPYPYAETQVAFDNRAAGVRLAGTLTTPPGEDRFAAVVLISGAGPQDRDETIRGHKPFLVLADHLTRHGVAVLRVDDRGVGGSTGEFAKATTRDLAADAAAAVAYLRTRPDIDPRRIGLIGHSEGGLIAPMLAAQDPRIAFIVLMAGPAVRGRDVLELQQRLIGQSLGLKPAQLEAGAALNQRIYTAILAAPDSAAAAAAAKAVMVDQAHRTGMPEIGADNQARQFGSDWYREFLVYDPGPTLARVRAPVLALNGSKDLQVSAAQNLPIMRRLLARHRDATVLELPGLNHLFQTAPTGAPYDGRIEETLAPIALTTISDWILARTRPGLGRRHARAPTQ